MRVRAAKALSLGSSENARWAELQAASEAFESPYFRPEFTTAVASVRGDVFVGLLEADGKLVGFFPFQRGRFRAGAPVGGHLSDYQGVVAQAGMVWDPVALVRACGLRAWDFDHLLASQAPFQPYHRRRAESPRIELAEGFSAYCERLRARSRRVDGLARKARKLEREVGPVRFVWHAGDPKVLDQVMRWKSQQCRRAGLADCFGPPWTRELLHALATTDTPEFAGVLSALYAGDRLAAAHFGMRSANTLHWWFPVYDHGLNRYSPGQLLLLRLAETCAERGIRSIDLGKGEDAYKSSFRTGAVELAEGAVVASASLAALRGVRERAEIWVRRSPLRGPARALNRLARRVANGPPGEVATGGAEDE